MGICVCIYKGQRLKQGEERHMWEKEKESNGQNI